MWLNFEKEPLIVIDAYSDSPKQAAETVEERLARTRRDEQLPVSVLENSKDRRYQAHSRRRKFSQVFI